MGHWFTHLAEGIDAEKECHTALARDPEACALLIGRLAAVSIEPEMLLDDRIGAADHLGFFESGREAVVYRFFGELPALQVLAMGRVENSIERGQLISEAQRRDAL